MHELQPKTLWWQEWSINISFNTFIYAWLSLHHEADQQSIRYFKGFHNTCGLYHFQQTQVGISNTLLDSWTRSAGSSGCNKMYVHWRRRLRRSASFRTNARVVSGRIIANCIFYRKNLAMEFFTSKERWTQVQWDTQGYLRNRNCKKMWFLKVDFFLFCNIEAVLERQLKLWCVNIKLRQGFSWRSSAFSPSKHRKNDMGNLPTPAQSSRLATPIIEWPPTARANPHNGAHCL